jgi:DNA-binding NtrC family response regulator
VVSLEASADGAAPAAAATPGGGHTILIVVTDPDFLEWAQRHLGAPGVEVVTECEPAKALSRYLETSPDLTITELYLGEVNGVDLLREIRQHQPNAMVILTTGFPPTSAVIESMKIGAYDFLGRQSLVYDLRPVVEGALKVREEMRSAAAAAGDAPSPEPSGQDPIIGKSPAMQDVFKMIGRVSRSDIPVMITGESGCGKEVVARAIHRFSPRARGEYVAINCAAIPENLLESELFGHEKGAFTGAAQRRTGRFEQCDGGTLFLDEIGDMPIQVQSKILRVLQEGEFSRVGSNETVRTDVRILAATNKDLEREVDAGRFREDLFYRLNVVRIHLPPLRQRREDIPLLAEFFLAELARKNKTPRLRLSDDALQLFASYDWPGNVRELENTIRRAAALATTEVLMPQDLPLGRVPRNASIAYRVGRAPVSAVGSPAAGEEPPRADEAAALAAAIDEAVESLLAAVARSGEPGLMGRLESDLAVAAMARSGGDADAAAKLLGISSESLRARLG